MTGAGAVGMAGMLATKAAGVTTLIMVDIVDERLNFAVELGATHTVNSKETDPVKAIKKITGGGANYALDTMGVPAVFTQMIRLHAQGLFPFDKLIKTYPFDEVNQAFADSAEGSTLKPVLMY